MTQIVSILLIGILFQVVPPVPDASNVFSLNIQAPQNTYKVGTPVKVQVTLTNKSGTNITITEAGPDDTFVVEMRNQGGEMPPRTHLGRILKGEEKPDTYFVSRRARSLTPDEKIEREVTLNNVYDLTSPGHYSFWVCKAIPNSGHREICSNHLTISIVDGK